MRMQLSIQDLNPMLVQLIAVHKIYPDSNVHGANMEPIWGRQDPGGPHVGPMNFAIWAPRPRLLTRITVEVWEWIINFTSHFVIDVIIYPCWDSS